MSGKYLVYSEYRDSGVEWLGDIPSEWKLTRLKFMAKIKNGQDYKSIEAEHGFPVMGSGGQFTYASKSMYDQESVLLGRKGTIDKPLYINEPFWTVDTMYYTEINKEVNAKYLYYLALTIQFKRYATNTALPSMTQENLAGYTFAIPNSKYDRVKIANFLDHETAKIDTLIEKQQQLIKLLKEKRQAVISHAVTKGLDPDVPMRDSGVEWLGDVPEHWEVAKLKYRTSVLEQGWSPQCDTRPAEKDEYGVLKVGCVNYSAFNYTENKALPKEMKPQLKYIIKKDDLLISRANTKELVGSAAVVDQDYKNLILCDKLYRLRFECNVLPQLVAYYFSLPVVRQQIELEATGASHSMQNIGQSTIRELPVVFPPQNEAHTLVDEIGKRIATFNSVLVKTNEQIILLRERRTALISAAVTGKIDVRDWKAPGEA